MTAGRHAAATRFDRALAGLQAATVGVFVMVLWLGLSANWRRESFWTSPNLMARAFRPSTSFHAGIAWSTAFGFALYVLLYGCLGCLFALVASRPIPRLRLTLLAIAFGLAWYWMVYQWLWRTALPVAPLIHGGRAAVLGHLIYGALLGRFPRYLPGAAETVAPPADEPVANADSGAAT